VATLSAARQAAPPELRVDAILSKWTAASPAARSASARTEPRRSKRVSHSGATAGYRAWLSEYPERQLAVAVLCNVSSGAATQYAHAVADVYLGLPATAATSATDGGQGSGSAPAARNPSALDALAGMYRRTDTGEPITVTREGDELRAGSGS
jgi:hypothetical protein